MTTQMRVPSEGVKSLDLPITKKTAAAIQAGVKTAGRMLFIDNLRVFLSIMVVVFHFAITYGAVGSWNYRERPTTEMAEILLTIFVILCQFYFMGLFFLVSGYFVPGSVERKGSWRFFKDRLIRLGIPLIAFTTLLSPIIEWVKGITEGYFTGNLWQFFVFYFQRGDYAPGPLWFVEILLAFSILYLLGKAVLRYLPSNSERTGTGSSQKPLTHFHILAFILALFPINFVVRLFSPIGVEWNHIQLAFLPQYSFMFAAGILAYRRGWLPDLPIRLRRTWSIVAILAGIALPVIMIIGGDTEPFMGGTTWQSLALSAWEAIYCVSMAILMLTIFRTRLDFQGSLGRFLSKNAYTVYIIHPPLIIGLAWSLRGLTIDPLLKFIFISPIGVGLCFLVSHYLVRRIPLADKVL